MSKSLVPVKFTEAELNIATRAVIVREALVELKDQVQSNVIEQAYLLKEAYDNAYYKVLGSTSFGEWIEEQIDLDMSERSAWYLVNVARKAEELGISKDSLKASKISKLKEIFSLDPTDYGEDTKRLVESSASITLEQVKDKVAEIQGQEPVTYMTLRIPRSVREGVINDAFELARRNYGSVVGEDGQARDISNSRCLELICAEYITDINNHPEDYQHRLVITTRDYEIIPEEGQ